MDIYGWNEGEKGLPDFAEHKFVAVSLLFLTLYVDRYVKSHSVSDLFLTYVNRYVKSQSTVILPVEVAGGKWLEANWLEEGGITREGGNWLEEGV